MPWLIFIVCVLCSIRALTTMQRDNSTTGIIGNGGVAVASAIAAYGAWLGI